MKRTAIQRLIQNLELSAKDQLPALIPLPFDAWPPEFRMSCWNWCGRMSRNSLRVARFLKRKTDRQGAVATELLKPRPVIQVQAEVKVLHPDTGLPTGEVKIVPKRTTGARFCWGVMRPETPLHRLHVLTRQEDLCGSDLCVNPFHHRLSVLEDRRWQGLKPDEQTISYVESAHDDIADLIDLLLDLQSSGFKPDTLQDVHERLPDFTTSEIEAAISRGKIKAWDRIH